jgi:hypothetical protein
MTTSAKYERNSPIPRVILVCVAVLPDRLSVGMASFRRRYHPPGHGDRAHDCDRRGDLGDGGDW